VIARPKKGGHVGLNAEKECLMKKTQIISILSVMALTAALVFTGCESLTGLLGGGGKSSGTAKSKNTKEPDTRDTSWYDGKSKETTFYIANAKQLMGMAKLSNLSKNSVDFSGKTIELTANIDLSEEKWRPISGFAGTFDGKGFSISNLTVTDYTNAALFGEVAMGTIKNLVVNVNKIETRKNPSENPSAGGLVAYGLGVTIENCGVNIKESITAYTGKTYYAYAGGLIGSLDGMPPLPGTPSVPTTISNCYVTGNVASNVTNGNGVGIAGGLIGTAGITIGRPVIDITNSYAVGTITATTNDANSFAGGLIGGGVMYTVNVKNSYTSATVTSTSGGRTTNEPFVGGFFGRWGGGTNNAAYYNSTKVPSQKMSSGADKDGKLMPTGITALSDADMKRQTSFKDFDFTSVWAIDTATNGGYPYLRWQKK